MLSETELRLRESRAPIPALPYRCLMGTGSVRTDPQMASLW